MPTLRDIQRRIRSVQSTQKITRAMKLVAAAKLRRAPERNLAPRPYASKKARLLGNPRSAAEGTHRAARPPFEQPEGARRHNVLITAERAGPPVDYIYEPSAPAILGDLLPRHVRMQVFRALMESLAGEYGARMTAMEAATKNAKDMIEILTIQYNKARQEKITKELLDIVGGAEALKQGAEA